MYIMLIILLIQVSVLPEPEAIVFLADAAAIKVR